MEEVLEDGERLGDDLVGLAPPDVHHKAHPATVVLELGIVQALPLGHLRRDR
jgi:hypothetical protein